MELARPLGISPGAGRSPLAGARVQRKLTVDQAAQRAALWPEQVEWLEEGRLYRFPSPDVAVLALLRYASALGIDNREARRLSGLPVEPPARRPLARWLAAGIAAEPEQQRERKEQGGGKSGSSAKQSSAAALPAPWHISVDVFNGSADINYTRQVASKIGSFGYRIQHVTKANRFDYRQTAVYFEPGGAGLAGRLASQLGCGTSTSPLPGGKNPHRLVVIVGPARATC